MLASNAAWLGGDVLRPILTFATIPTCRHCFWTLGRLTIAGGYDMHFESRSMVHTLSGVSGAGGGLHKFIESLRVWKLQTGVNW